MIQINNESAIYEGLFSTFIEKTDSIGYAFKVNNGKFIQGEYIFFPEEKILFDGFINFEDYTITYLKRGNQ